MNAITIAVVLGLAAKCQDVVAPAVIVGIAQRESGLDPLAVHVNVDGSRDRGLMGINERNDHWLGLQDPFDPCQSISAAARLLASFSRYNSGSPTRSLLYAQAVAAKVATVNASGIPLLTPAPEEEADLEDRPAGIVSTELKGQ